MKPARRILVVDDEALIAMVVEDMLSDIGCQVVGPVGTVADALALIHPAAVDAALVDVNLHGTSSDPIAHRLRQHNIPFAFVTGMGERRDGDFADAPLLQKPFNADDFERTVSLLLAMPRPAPSVPD